jgi:hypothetical protein
MWRKPKRLDVAELASFTSAVKLAGLDTLPVGSLSRAAMGRHTSPWLLRAAKCESDSRAGGLHRRCDPGVGTPAATTRLLRLSIHLPIVRDAAVLVIDSDLIGFAHSMTQPDQTIHKMPKNKPWVAPVNPWKAQKSHVEL